MRRITIISVIAVLSLSVSLIGCKTSEDEPTNVENVETHQTKDITAQTDQNVNLEEKPGNDTSTTHSQNETDSIPPDVSDTNQTLSADFQANVLEGQAPLWVTFNNDSVNADECQWDFGDGESLTTSASDDEVTHKFTKAGIYSVELKAIKNGNPLEIDSITRTINVTHGPPARLVLSPNNAMLASGQSLTIRADLHDACDNLIPNAQLTWKIIDGVGLLNQDGVFTAPIGDSTSLVTIMVSAQYLDSIISTSSVITISEWSLTYLGMNAKVLPYNDTRIRNAVSLLINQEELLPWVRENYPVNAQPVLSIVDPESTGTVTISDWNVEKANNLLASAGYPDGFSATRFYVTPGLELLAQKMSTYFAEVDMNTKIISISFSDLNDLEIERKTYGDWGHLFLTNTSVDWNSPEEVLGRLCLSNGEENYTEISDSKFDQLFNSGSYVEAEGYFFEIVKIIVPLYWNIPVPIDSQMLLNLGTPEIDGSNVTINGATETWALKIHWDWGDGNGEDAWFPASHTYERKGTYNVTVITYGPSGVYNSNTMIIDIE